MQALAQLSGSVRQGDVFRDFAEASYCAIAKATAGTTERRDELEGRFVRIIERYADRGQPNPRDAFGEMLAHLVLALEDRPHDFLGGIFQELFVANARAGQFFTPDSVSRVMAEMSLLDRGHVEALVRDRGYFTLCEPCCGAGGMVIQAAEVVKAFGFSPAQHMRVTMIDIDPVCCQMAFIQVALLGINAVVVRGDSLRMEFGEFAYTPVALLHPWRREEAAAADADEPDPAPAPAPLALPAPKPAQLGLFDSPGDAT